DRFLRRAKKDLGEPRRNVRFKSTETGVDGSKDDRHNELLRTGQDLSDAGRKTESHEPRHESGPQARNDRPQPCSQLVVLHAASPPRRRVISFTIASAWAALSSPRAAATASFTTEVMTGFRASATACGSVEPVATRPRIRLVHAVLSMIASRRLVRFLSPGMREASAPGARKMWCSCAIRLSRLFIQLRTDCWLPAQSLNE